MPIASNDHVLLPGSFRIKSPGSVAVRPVDPASEINVTLKLARRAALPAIRSDIPQILSADELTGTYGASPDEIKQVQNALARYGIRTLSISPETRSIRVIGTASALEQAFQTKLFHFEGPEGAHRGRTGSLSIPVSLDGLVVGVFGLDDRRAAQTRPARKSASFTSLFAAEIAKLYGFPSGSGTGQTVALLEFGGGYFAKDLTKFWHLAGNTGQPLPHVVPISVDGTPMTARDGAEDEVMLDVEVVASALPGARISVYFSNFDEQGWVDILDRVIQDKPTVVSVSWGLAEDSSGWTAGGIQAINDALHQAALLGLTVLVASGDDGSDDQVGDGLAHVDFPASSPFVLAVGGTEFTVVQGAITDEVGWKDGDGLRKDGGGSSGGGVSTVNPRPDWQTVQVVSVNPNAINGRVIPDVAALAGLPGYVLVVDGKVSGNGGTSAATPLWACLVALLAASLASNGKQLPFLTPLLYKASGASTIGSLGTNDITSGDNSTAQVGGYEAKVGYDAVTGWGSPKGTALLDALNSIL